MKEFKDKLIERLEQQEQHFTNEYYKGYGDEDRGKYIAYGDAIEIVNQLADEYGKDTNVAANNGYVPSNELNKKQLMALKFAINTMERNFSRHCMSYLCCGGEKICYGEAINVLSDMVNQEAKTHENHNKRAETHECSKESKDNG